MKVVNDRRRASRIPARGEVYLHTRKGVMLAKCLDVSRAGMSVEVASTKRITGRVRVVTSFDGTLLDVDGVIARRRRAGSGSHLGLSFDGRERPVPPVLDEILGVLQVQAGLARQASALLERLPRFIAIGPQLPTPGMAAAPSPAPAVGSAALPVGSGSGPLPMGPGSGPLPMGPGSGPLPVGSGSGPLPVGSGSGPLPMGPGSGPLPVGSGSGPLPMGPGSGPLPVAPTESSPIPAFIPSLVRRPAAPVEPERPSFTEGGGWRDDELETTQYQGPPLKGSRWPTLAGAPGPARTGHTVVAPMPQAPARTGATVLSPRVELDDDDAAPDERAPRRGRRRR